MTTVDTLLVELLASPPAAVTTVAELDLLDALEYAIHLGEGAQVAPLLAELAAHPPFPYVAQVLLGHALIEQGQLRQARAPLRAALGQHPLDPIAWAALGATFPAGHPAAEASFRRAALHATGLWEIPLESRHLAAVAAPAAALQLLRDGRKADALDALARQLRRQPNRRDLLIYYAEALRRNGRLTDAHTVLGRLISSQACSLPLVWLMRALDAERLPPQLVQKQRAVDPGDRMAQRFFAPEPLPWEAQAPTSRPLSPRWQAVAEPYLQRPTVKRAAPQPKRASADPQLDGLIELANDRVARMGTLAPIAAPRRPIVASPTDTQQALLITASDSLRRAIGADGTRRVLARLAVLCQVLTANDRPAALLDLSQPETLVGSSRIGRLPFAPEPSGLVGGLRRIAELHDSFQSPLSTVLLIGGDGVIPFVRLPNTVPDGDLDIPSDLPYGCDSATQVLARRVVARLPDGGSAELLLQLIEAMLARHSRRSNAPARRWPWQRAAAQPASVGSYSAAAWRAASAAVLAHAGLDAGELPICPPSEGELALRAITPAALLYCNLHGAIGSANWYGQPEDGVAAAVQRPIACTPAALAKAQLTGSILVSEACYGMELGTRSVEQSIPLTLLRQGGAACVGSTINAYGSSAPPLVAADLLTAALMRGLSQGQTVGDAMQTARTVLAQEMEQRQGYLDEIDLKTMNGFVLYGDPWASACSAPATVVAPSAGAARPERRPAARMVESASVAPALMRQVRQRMSHLVSPQASMVIRASADAVAGAKDGSADLLTFSAHDVSLTPDGYYSAQAAHVTVRDGQIVKTVISR